MGSFPENRNFRRTYFNEWTPDNFSSCTLHNYDFQFDSRQITFSKSILQTIKSTVGTFRKKQLLNYLSNREIAHFYTNYYSIKSAR